MQIRKVKFILLSDKITRIGNYSFNGMINLHTVTIPESVEIIGSNPFVGCESLKTVICKSKNYSVIDGMLLTKDKSTLISFFDHSNEKELLLPQEINTIGKYAIYGVKQLEKIIIQKNVDIIQQSGIANCESLKYIYFLNTTEPSVIDTTVLSDCNQLESIYVPVAFVTSFPLNFPS